MVQSREVLQTITAHQQREGAGFLVRRPFPTNGLDHVDPFLMLDDVGPFGVPPVDVSSFSDALQLVLCCPDRFLSCHFA